MRGCGLAFIMACGGLDGVSRRSAGGLAYLREYDAVTCCIATRYQWLSGVVDRLGGCGVSSLSL